MVCSRERKKGEAESENERGRDLAQMERKDR